MTLHVSSGVGSGVGRRPGAWRGLTSLAAGMAIASALAVGIRPAAAWQDAKGDAAGEKAPPNPKPFVAFERAPLSEFLTDPKDAAFKHALSMIPQRIDDLPKEVGMPADAADLVKTILMTIAKPSRVAITYTPDYQKAGAFGYGLIISSMMESETEAKALHTKISAMLAKNGADAQVMPSDEFPGLSEVTLPVAPLHFGPRKGAKGATYDVIWGAVANADAAFESIPKASPGMKTVINGVLDFEQLTTLVGLGKSAVSAGGGPQGSQMANQVTKKLSSYGLFGADAVLAHFQMGYTPDASVTHVEVKNFAKPLRAMGMDGPALTNQDMAVIPSDAVMASISVSSTKPWVDTIQDMMRMEPQAQQAMAEFKQRTGVDPLNDVLGSLGGVGVVYASDTTGGGSIGSTVMLMSFADRAKFISAHDKLVAFGMKMLAENPDSEEMAKYIRLDVQSLDDTKIYALRTPGIPIPFELSYAMTPRFLVVGLTPQAVLAAVKQATGKGDPGLMSRAEGSSQVPKGKELVSFTFADTPGLMGAGYPLVTMASLALANGVRSPSDPSRDPGMLMPLFNDLKKNVRPTVTITYKDGETLVLHSTADRSMLAGASGAVGGMLRAWPVIGAIGAAIAVGGFRDRFGAMLPEQAEQKFVAYAFDAAAGPNAWIMPSRWMMEGMSVMPEMDVVKRVRNELESAR